MRWALITGASAGLGAEFARQLGERGWNLVLSARRAALLEALAEEIRLASSVEVLTAPADIASQEGVQQLLSAVQQLGLVPDLVVNAANAGQVGESTELPADRILNTLRVNVEALTTMLLHFGQIMKERGRGAIINVSSPAGFQPMPYFAVYAASKSYGANFSEALALELRPCGIQVLTVFPSQIDSSFNRNMQSSRLPLRLIPMKDVVSRSLKALDKGSLSYIDGVYNMVNMFLNRILPRRTLPAIMAWAVRKQKRKGHSLDQWERQR